MRCRPTRRCWRCASCSSRAARRAAHGRESPPAREPRRRPPAEVVWHDLECGLYRADLPLWRELPPRPHRRGGEPAPRDRGRHRARDARPRPPRATPSTALERDPTLLAALARARRRAAGADGRAATPATSRSSARDFALCLVPMQTVQLMGGAARAARVRARRARTCAPGALLACALVGGRGVRRRADELEPDARAGSRSASASTAAAPLRVSVGRARIRIERERSVEPGERRPALARRERARRGRARPRSATEQLAAGGRRGRAAHAEPTRLISETEEHTASAVVILGA